MKMTIIAIFDRKAQIFVEMSATQNVGVATRAFSAAINTPSESPIHKWPEDFELYNLGEWDNETGALTGAKHKKLIVAGESVKTKAN